MTRTNLIVTLDDELLGWWKKLPDEADTSGFISYHAIDPFPMATATHVSQDDPPSSHPFVTYVFRRVFGRAGSEVQVWKTGAGANDLRHNEYVELANNSDAEIASAVRILLAHRIGNILDDRTRDYLISFARWADGQ